MSSLLRCLTVCSASLTATAVANATLSAELAVPIHGQPFRASMIAIDQDWSITLQDTHGGRRELSAVGLVRWGHRRRPTGSFQIATHDGSLLVIDGSLNSLVLKNDHLTIDAPAWERIRIPVAAILGIVMSPPIERLQYDKLLDRLSRGRSSEDVLLLTNGDQLTGTVTSLVVDKVTLELGRATQELPLDRVSTIIFGSAPSMPSVDGTPTSPEEINPDVEISLSNGSRLRVDSMELSSGKLELELAAGFRLVARPFIRPIEEGLVSGLQPMNLRKSTYVSDMKPIGYKHIPFLELSWPLGVDRNALGGQLYVGGRVYSKGLGMHSLSRVAFNLNREYERFDGQIALDDSAEQGGSVTYRVYGNRGDEPWREIYKSEVVRGGDPPRSISVDVAQLEQMALVVEFADRGDELDRANWLDARLIGVD